MTLVEEGTGRVLTIPRAQITLVLLQSAMPRFRAELGPFIGLAGSIDHRQLRNGFDPIQTERGRMTGPDDL